MYFLEPNLSRMCLISLTKYLWETEENKTCLYGDKKEWFKITKRVLDHAQFVLDKLPAKLKTELEDVIVYIGEEICSWKEYLVKNLKLNPSFGDIIYFTPFGTIDEVQIFEKYWCENNGLFENSKYNLYDLSCIFALEKYVFKWRYEIIDNMYNRFLEVMPQKAATKKVRELKMNMIAFTHEERHDVAFALLSIWINHHFELALDVDGISQLRQRIILLSFKSNLIHILKFFVKSAPFFYKECYNEFLILSARRSCKENKDLTNYERKKYLEIVLLVINENSGEQKVVMISHHHEALLKWVLKHWPYQVFFQRILYFSTVMGFIKKTDWLKYIMLVAKADEEDYLAGLSIKRNTYYTILKDIWGKQKTGKSTEFSKMWYIQLIEIFLKTLNFRSLKILLTHDLSNFFEYNTLEWKILTWLLEGNNDLINKFFQEALDDDKQEPLKEKIKTSLTRHFICEGNTSGIEKLSNWLSVPIEIDGIDAAESMIKRFNGHLAENFFKWLYDNDEGKIHEVKNHFRNEEFCRNRIFDAFSQGLTFDEMKEYGLRFFNFIFDSPEDITNCKLAILKDEQSILDFAKCCDQSNYNGEDYEFKITDLTDFCELPEDKIAELKKKCIDNMEKLTNSFTSDCMCYIVLAQLFDWLGEKEKLIKQFMKTPASVKMCDVMFNIDMIVNEPDDNYNKKIILEFYNTWVRSSENIPQIKKELEDFNKEKLTEADKSKLSAMFDKLERGEDLKLSDLFCYIVDESEVSEESDDDSDHDSEYIESPDGYIRDMFGSGSGSDTTSSEDSDF